MSKTRIELPENVDYRMFLDQAIDGALKSGELDNTKYKMLNRLGDQERNLLAKAIKIAAEDEDGLLKGEVDTILGDIFDLVHAAANHKTFKKMLADPSNPKWELSSDVVEALQKLSSTEQELTYLRLHELRPSIAAEISSFFIEIGRALKPIFDAVAEQMIKIGAVLLADLATKNIQNKDIKDLTSDFFIDSGNAIGNVIGGKEKLEDKKEDDVHVSGSENSTNLDSL